MDKEYITQKRLKEAERILKTVLEDEQDTSREYLVALVTTYFNNIKITKGETK